MPLYLVTLKRYVSLTEQAEVLVDTEDEDDAYEEAEYRADQDQDYWKVIEEDSETSLVSIEEVPHVP